MRQVSHGRDEKMRIRGTRRDRTKQDYPVDDRLLWSLPKPLPAWEEAFTANSRKRRSFPAAAHSPF